MSDRKYDPRVPFDVWLPAFDEWPADIRPVFTYRRMTAGEFNTLSDAIDARSVMTDQTEIVDKMFEITCIGLLKWSNQVDVVSGTPIDHDAAKIRDVINYMEADTIFTRRMKAITLTPEDKKKLESQGSSASDSSAESASPASA